jgi:hypothetical protein
MVRTTLTTVALLAVCRAVGAAPSAVEPAVVRSDFSFAHWINQVIESPDTALTPEQALEAFYAARNNTGSVGT